MKTRWMIKLALKTILLLNPAVFAAESWNDVDTDERLSPDVLGSLVGSLSQQRLKSSKANEYTSPILEFDLRGALLSGAATSDGIPEASKDSNNVEDILPRAYNTVQLLKIVLEERTSYPLGPRLRFMESGIRNALKSSADKNTEESMRETLNRALDIISIVLPISGNTPGASAQWATNFYRSVIELAIGLQNNDMERIISISKVKDLEDEAVHVPGMTSAKFGQIYSNLLYRFSTSIGTRAAKAALLMRLIGYLGHDLNEDLNRRDPGISETLADIYRLQNDPIDRIYEEILQEFRRGRSPSRQQLARLRSKVYGILAKLPERLGNAQNVGRPF